MPRTRDWSRFARDYRDAGPLERALILAHAVRSDPHPREFPLFRSNFYGSSLNFEMEVRAFYPSLRVDEHGYQPALGPQPGWSPAREAPPPPDEACAWCGGRFDDPELYGGERDADGTRFVCPKCLASAADARLARQRQLAGDPPPEPEPGKGKRPTRRQRREALYARVNAAVAR